jgi:predicted DNA-binding transcriptional regulator YafY
MYLCKQLFMYGVKVEILEPKELRDLMIDMLKKSLSVYK